MAGSANEILKYAVAGCGGLALAGLIYGCRQVLRETRVRGLNEGEPGSVGAGAGGQNAGPTTSMRREEMRDLALASTGFRLLLPWLNVINGMTRQMNLDFLRTYLRGPYAQAGYPGGLEDDEVVALGLLIGMGVTLFLAFSLAVLFGPAWMALGLMGMPLGVLILVTNLKSQATVREIKILQALPYLLDLMVLMLRSGTSLRIALGRVVEDYRTHPIGVELGQVLAEIDVGSSRAEAFRRLADRLKIQDLTSLSDAIVQSEELGWPLAETLERLADRLSSERMLRAQNKAGAAGVLVMLPSTMVLAAAVLLLFSPIIVKLLRTGSLAD